MQKIRVLHILHSFGIGGLEKGISMLINHASPEFEHIVLCLTCSGDSKYLIPDSVPIHEMNKPSGNSILFIFKLAQKIRQIRPDVVHTRNWGGMDGVVASLLAGCSNIVHGEHGWGMDDPQGTNSKRKFARRWLSIGIKEFTVVSPPLKEWLENEVRVFSPVNQIFNGVALSTAHDSSCVSTLRQELGLPSNSLLVGTVARLDPIKDQAGLMFAFKYVREQVVECHLLIVGDGPERKNLEHLCFEGIHLLGMRTDVSEIMQSLDVFVLPSLSEGVSNTILEAMAAGLPVVATKVGGTRELIKHEHNGLLVEPRDYSALALALVKYLKNPSLRNQHGNRNQEIVNSRFSISAMVSAYEMVWRRVAMAERRL